MRRAGLWFGPLVFGGVATAGHDQAAAALGLLLWMVLWWVSECVAPAVTALLPLLVLPLAGVMPMDSVAQPYGSKIIFLFLGGFMMATALEKHQVHRQVALRILALAGTAPRRILAALMGTTALLSMWMSNTATTLMMMPIAMAVVAQMGGPGQMLRKPLLLGIAYAASLGGMATLVGSPPNIALAGFLENRYGVSITFAQWLLLGLPVSATLLLIFYLLLSRIAFRAEFARESPAFRGVRSLQAMIQPWTPAQRRMLQLMGAVITLWLVREFLPLPHLTDHAIALAGGVMLFLLPVPGKKNHTLLTWDDAKQLPWGILLLFGGGLAMAQGLEKAGLIVGLGQLVADSGLQTPYLYMVAFTVLGLAMTEFMSNVALVNVLIPVLFGIADTLFIPPLYLGLPVTLASSCAFMFPIATPPNAVVYSTGFIPIRDMVRLGIWMNLAALLMIILFAEAAHRLHLLSHVF